MDLSQVLLQPPILNLICKNLTIEEANEFRQALNLESLKCSITVDDRDGQILSLKEVDQNTILIYHNILKYGSKKFLNLAVIKNNLPLIRFLVHNGSDVNMPDRNNMTNLMIASERGYTEVVRFLLTKNPNINEKSTTFNDRYTALMFASKYGYDEIVKLLLEHYADVNITDQFNTTALMIASQNGRYKVVKLLLATNEAINSVNLIGYSALMLAMQYDEREIVDLFLQNFLNIDVNDHNGLSNLNEASKYGYDKVVKYLLEHGANVNFIDQNGKTALTWALEKNHSKIIEMLQKIS